MGDDDHSCLELRLEGAQEVPAQEGFLGGGTWELSFEDRDQAQDGGGSGGRGQEAPCRRN